MGFLELRIGNSIGEIDSLFLDVVSTGIICVVLVVLLDTCVDMLSGVTWDGVNL